MPQLNFNMLATDGPQGVFQGFMQGQQLQNRLAQQEQQRQLGELQLQNALREQRLAGEEEAAYKAAGNDYAHLQSELMQRGLGKQALAVGAQQAKLRADQIKMHKDTVELTKTAAQQVMANPQNAAQILSSFGQRYGIDMADDLAQIQQLGGNPEAIRQWAAGVAVQADKLLPQFETMNLGGGVARQGYNRITGAPIAPATFTENVPLPAAVEAQKSRIAKAGAANVFNVQEKAEAGAFGKMLVDQYQDISKAAGLAIKTLPAIEANLGALNKGLDTGFGADAKKAGARILGALGVQDAEKFAANAEMFQSNAVQAVLQKQLEQKGPQTESDARRIEQVGAELGKTKAANEFILSMAKEQLRRDVEQRNFYDKWKKQTGSFEGAEDAWFSGEGGKSLFDRPALKKYAPGAAVGQSAVQQIPGQRPAAAPAAPAVAPNIDALLNKYR